MSDIEYHESGQAHQDMYDELMRTKAALDAQSKLLAEAREALEETTAEAIEHRKNIIECHSGDFQPVPDPRYKAAMQKEIARFDALIERSRAVLAKLKAAGGEG